jgi:hypothetical protein
MGWCTIDAPISGSLHIFNGLFKYGTLVDVARGLQKHYRNFGLVCVDFFFFFKVENIYPYVFQCVGEEEVAQQCECVCVLIKYV